MQRPLVTTRTAVALHWLIFVLIACSFPLAVYMVDLPLSPQKLKYFSWHKWIGVTVFLLAIARLAWRWRHAAPPLPAAMTAWQQRTAAATHVLLYVLIVVIPLTGWLYSSATGVPTVYLGLVQLPDLVGKDKPARRVAQAGSRVVELYYADAGHFPRVSGAKAPFRRRAMTCSRACCHG